MPSRDTYRSQDPHLLSYYRDGVRVVAEEEDGESMLFGIEGIPEGKSMNNSQLASNPSRPRFSLRRPSRPIASLRFVREASPDDSSTVSLFSREETQLGGGREGGPMKLEGEAYRPMAYKANTKRKRDPIISDVQEQPPDEDGKRVQEEELASRRTKRLLTTYQFGYPTDPVIDEQPSPSTHWLVVDQNTFRRSLPNAEIAVQDDTIPIPNQLVPPTAPQDYSFTSSGISDVDLHLVRDTPMGSPWTDDTEASPTPESLNEVLSTIASQSPSKTEDGYQAPWSSAYRRADGLGAEWTIGEAPEMTLEITQFQDLRARVDTISDASSRASAVSDGEKYLYDDTCWGVDSLLVGIERGMDLLGVTENHHLSNAEDQ